MFGEVLSNARDIGLWRVGTPPPPVAPTQPHKGWVVHTRSATTM
jgi:hypothetical protein